MARRKRRYSDEALARAVKSNISMAGALRELGLVPAGGNYHQVQEQVRAQGLSTEHWLGQGHWKGRPGTRTPTPLDQLLVAGRLVGGPRLRCRLVLAGKLKDSCYICGISEWQGRPLTLHLDHISGDHLDNRLENLRLLCPNCHSQTDTYCGKNIGRRSRVSEPSAHISTNQASARMIGPVTLCACGAKKAQKASKCHACHMQLLHQLKRQKKIEWPSKEELQTRVWQTPVSTLARDLGVSDAAIKKHCKRLGIDTPARGYWAKINAT